MDLVTYGQFAGALLIVVGLIVLIGLGARRFGFAPGMPRGGGRKTRRLVIEEVLPLDARRRLVLVRHGHREHLLLLGADGDLVVETGAASPHAPPAPAAGPAADPLHREAP